jgi:hypothetical protein
MAFDPRLVRDGYELTHPRTESGAVPILKTLPPGPDFDRALIDTLSWCMGDMADTFETIVQSDHSNPGALDDLLVDAYSLLEILTSRSGFSMEELARKSHKAAVTTGVGGYGSRRAIIGYRVDSGPTEPPREVTRAAGGWLAHHRLDECSSGLACCIHNPSDHPMKEFPLVWRDDKNAMERRCPHGTGHPDPDDLMYKILMQGWNPDNTDGLTVHGSCTDETCCCTGSYKDLDQLIAASGKAFDD